jgi:hypothetical protein
VPCWELFNPAMGLSDFSSMSMLNIQQHIYIFWNTLVNQTFLCHFPLQYDVECRAIFRDLVQDSNPFLRDFKFLWAVYTTFHISITFRKGWAMFSIFGIWHFPLCIISDKFHMNLPASLHCIQHILQFAIYIALVLVPESDPWRKACLIYCTGLLLMGGEGRSKFWLKTWTDLRNSGKCLQHEDG